MHTHLEIILFSFIYLNLPFDCLLPGIVALFHSLTLFLLLSHCPSLYLIAPASFLTMLTVRIAVLYTLILTITRTINIVRPFVLINTTIIKSVMLFVPLLLWVPVIIHQMSAPLPPGLGSAFAAITSSSRVGDSLVRLIAGGYQHHLSIFLCLIIPFGLPSLVALVSMFIQLQSLLKSTMLGDKHARSAKRSAAVTIFLLTVAFSFCNSASTVLWLFFCYSSSSITAHSIIWIYVTSVTIPFLNSAINPTILIFRGNNLRSELLSRFNTKHEGRKPSTTILVLSKVRG